MEALFYAIVVAVFLGLLAILLFPISLRFDSTREQFRVAWLGLSFTKKLSSKKLLGPIAKREKEEEPPTAKGETQKKKKHRIKAIGRFLLHDRYLILELLRKGYRPLINVLHAVSLRELEASFSTPDPMWNGVLFGVFSNIHLDNVRLSANFTNINYVRGRMQLYPYQIVKMTTSLMIRLPYRRIIKTFLYIKKSRKRRNYYDKRA